ncbi:MAG: Response regulator with antiterminator output domain, partial [Modestobacter sp.]|nr:Response regulator with antiterminator output domain [Modestobacter sp.]
DNKPSTAVHTGQLALDLDESQYGRGHGPCLHAATSGELVEIAGHLVRSGEPGP